jgi:hypothetical protein
MLKRCQNKEANQQNLAPAQAKKRTENQVKSTAKAAAKKP